MLKAIIVEDEDKSAENLRLLITEFCKDVQVVGISRSIAEAVTMISTTCPDVVFLDINLKTESGFDLFTKIQQIQFKVIFTTAYSTYATEAFRVSALDYLLKPINIRHLQESVERVKQSMDGQLGIKIEKLLSHLNSDASLTKLTISTTNGIFFINTQDIIYCESDSNYTKIYLSDGKKYTASKTIKYYESILPDNLFFRIHNSYVVNLNHIKKYNKSDSAVTMENDTVLDVSKRKQSDFLNKVGLQ